MKFGENMKGQNALEYLITHVWMLLILVVVIAAIFSLGIFSSTNLAPRAQAGSCTVSRPYGPGKISLISLAGECGSLLPEYVGSFGGVSSIIVTSSNGYVPTGDSSRTITAWVYINPQASATNVIAFYGIPNGGSGQGQFYINYSGTLGKVCVGGNQGQGHVACIAASTGVWHMVAATFNGSLSSLTFGFFLDGNYVSVFDGSFTMDTNSGPFYIGGNSSGDHFNGRIANVQLYGAALTQNSLKTLYAEGIGGPPINLGNLVGWWPLNGNAQDYSGNNQTGVATNVIYTTQWTTGYTPP
jgi:hypothetical protein